MKNFINKMACSLVHLRGNIAFINDGIIIPIHYQFSEVFRMPLRMSIDCRYLTSKEKTKPFS